MENDDEEFSNFEILQKGTLNDESYRIIRPHHADDIIVQVFDTEDNLWFAIDDDAFTNTVLCNYLIHLLDKGK